MPHAHALTAFDTLSFVFSFGYGGPVLVWLAAMLVAQAAVLRTQDEAAPARSPTSRRSPPPRS